MITTDAEIKFPYPVTDGNVTVKIYWVKSPTKPDGTPKIPQGHYYQISDHSGTTRKLISVVDFEEAKAKAKQIAKLTRAGDKVALELRGAPAMHYAESLRLLGETPMQEAIRRYCEAVKILGSAEKLVDAAKFFVARHPSDGLVKPLAYVIEEMLTLKTSRKKSARYIDDLRGRLHRFAQATPFKAKLEAQDPKKPNQAPRLEKSSGMNVSEVTTSAVQTWLDSLKLSPQSYKNYRTVISGLFAYAEARGYIAKGANPVESVEKIESAMGEVAIFTPGEFSSLLNAASKDFLPALAIGGFAGLRSAEIQRLDWQNIDLESRYITVSAENAKTASRRVVPISHSLAAWLNSVPKREGAIWTRNENDFVNAQRRTAKDAGIKWKGNALRHSYASYRLSETEDASKVAFEMGNSAPIVHRHYKELVKPADAKAWFAIMPPQA